MRNVFLIPCILLFLFMLSACSEKAGGKDILNETDAANLGKEFIEQIYNIELDGLIDMNDPEPMLEYQNEFADYLTEDEFEDLFNRRFFLIPQEAAERQNSSIAVNDIEFELTKKEEESMAFDLSFIIEFTDINQEENITGQMTVSKTDDSLRISRYYDQSIRSDLFVPKGSYSFSK